MGLVLLEALAGDAARPGIGNWDYCLVCQTERRLSKCKVFGVSC